MRWAQSCPLQASLLPAPVWPAFFRLSSAQLEKKERKRWESRGRSLLLEYGVRIGCKWWTAKGFEEAGKALKMAHSPECAASLLEILEHYREQVLVIHTRLLSLTEELKREQKELQLKRCEANGGKKAQRPIVARYSP